MSKKNKYSDFPNCLQLKPKFLECQILISSKNFGQIQKKGKDLSLDELVDWFKDCDIKSKNEMFLGVIPPNYVSPFDKKFPKSPILEDETE